MTWFYIAWCVFSRCLVVFDMRCLWNGWRLTHRTNIYIHTRCVTPTVYNSIKWSTNVKLYKFDYKYTQHVACQCVCIWLKKYIFGIFFCRTNFNSHKSNAGFFFLFAACCIIYIEFVWKENFFFIIFRVIRELFISHHKYFRMEVNLWIWFSNWAYDQKKNYFVKSILFKYISSQSLNQ